MEAETDDQRGRAVRRKNVVANALQLFEEISREGDHIKVIDYARLLDSQKETPVERPGRVIVRWADTWEQTNASEE